MASVEGRYDYVIVDCPPNVGLLTFNTLKACSEAIVPMDPSFFSLHGLGKLLETIEVLAKETDHHIAVRALVTLYSGRSAFAKAVLDEIRRHLDGRWETDPLNTTVEPSPYGGEDSVLVMDEMVATAG